MPGTVTEDTLFDGALRLVQPARGHRAGTDAVLLAAACPPDAKTVCDLGAGVGTVGLRAAQTLSDRRVDLIDIDQELAALATENARRNGLSERCRVHVADVFARGPARNAALDAMAADVVLTNPPFAEPGMGRASPLVLKARAHVLSGDLDGWVKAARRLLRPKGAIVLIHRADAAERVLAAMRGRFGGLQLKFIHPRADAPATRLLIRGTAASRAPLTVLAPLVLHEADGRFTPEADALHRGRASVAWHY